MSKVKGQGHEASQSSVTICIVNCRTDARCLFKQKNTFVRCS